MLKEGKSTMNEKMYYNLGLNIRGLRKTFKETQRELAEAVGLDKGQAISNYELGERVPERDILLKIAKHYRVTENELLYGDFSQMKKIINVPVADEYYQKTMIEKVLHIKVSEHALENVEFKEAYELHNKLYENVIKGTDVDIEEIEKCVGLYDSACKQGIVEGAVNSLWWSMFFCLMFSFVTPRLIEGLEKVKREKISIDMIIKNGYLQTFSNEEEKEEWKKLKEEYMNGKCLVSG